MGKKTKKSKKNRSKSRGRNSSTNNAQSRDPIRTIEDVLTDGYVHIDPDSGVSSEEALAMGPQLVTNELLDAVLSRGVVNDERCLYKRAFLRSYFLQLMNSISLCPHPQFDLIVAVLIGLTNGPAYINRRIDLYGGEEPLPILHWVCQWKLLRANSHRAFTAGDELVDMVVKAGADVNATIRNKTNAMFFAVKHVFQLLVRNLVFGSQNGSLARSPAFLEENQLISEAKFRGSFEAGENCNALRRRIIQESVDGDIMALSSVPKMRMELGASMSLFDDKTVFGSPHCALSILTFW
jgi:hypothetical protein